MTNILYGKELLNGTQVIPDGEISNLTLTYNVSPVAAYRIVSIVELAADYSAAITIASALLGAGLGGAAVQLVVQVVKKKLLKEGRNAAIMY